MDPDYIVQFLLAMDEKEMAFEVQQMHNRLELFSCMATGSTRCLTPVPMASEQISGVAVSL